MNRVKFSIMVKIDVCCVRNSLSQAILNFSGLLVLQNAKPYVRVIVLKLDATLARRSEFMETLLPVSDAEPHMQQP